MVSKEPITLRLFLETSTGKRLKKDFSSIKGRNPLDQKIKTPEVKDPVKNLDAGSKALNEKT
jgi:hypothetical protein